jgi:hypothetical protein
MPDGVQDDDDMESLTIIIRLTLRVRRGHGDREDVIACSIPREVPLGPAVLYYPDLIDE